jgi:Post-segregation antitoxin CcdA
MSSKIIRAASLRRNYDKRRGQYNPNDPPKPYKVDDLCLIAIYQSEYRNPSPPKHGTKRGRTKETRSVTLSVELLKKVEDLGINLSKACEEGLKIIIDRLESNQKQNER